MPAPLFEKVRTASRLLGEAVAELDGDVLDVEAAKQLVDLFTRCERHVAAGRQVAARRVASAVNWKHAGHRSPAEWLAATTGVGVGEAGRALETARRLETLTATSDAFRSGEISEAQASEIAAAATVDPDAEAHLLETARGGASYRKVRDQCRETTMRAADDAARARRLHETRNARTYTGTDGHVVLHAELAPDVGARVVSVLNQKTDELFRAARTAGTTELRAAYAADAVAALILGQTPVPAPDVRLHLDHAPLVRGYAEHGERCHLDGVGPIPVAVAKAMLQDAKVTVLRHDDTGDITSVSSPTRTIQARLRRWVEEAYPTCGRHGCDSTFRLEIDHIVPLAAGGRTEKANLWRLCGHDHHLKTYRGWNVVTHPDGTRDLVPPAGHPPRDHMSTPDAPDPPRRD
jgi:5-methylcytosine-specific restriction endonuclease McrA